MATNEVGIHYRTGGKLTHCGCECLPQGQDIPRIIIEKIEFRDREQINGRTEMGVWVATFAPNPYTKLPFILNSTNRRRLAKMFPQVDGCINLLKNIPVRLTREKTRDVQDGGETWGLRISKMPAAPEPKAAAPAPAKPAAKKVITEDKVDAVVAWAKENGKTVADIEAVYDMSEVVKNAIIDALA